MSKLGFPAPAYAKLLTGDWGLDEQMNSESPCSGRSRNRRRESKQESVHRATLSPRSQPQNCGSLSRINETGLCASSTRRATKVQSPLGTIESSISSTCAKSAPPGGLSAVANSHPWANFLRRLSKVIGVGIENPDDLASLRPSLILVLQRKFPGPRQLRVDP